MNLDCKFRLFFICNMNFVELYRNFMETEILYISADKVNFFFQ